MRVKICGVNGEAAFDAVVAAGADYLGFVFFPPSPRHVTAPQAARLSARHAGGPGRVGLFVDPSDGEVAAVLDVLPLSALQVYATPPRITSLRELFGLPIWRAVGVSRAGELPDDDDDADAWVVEAKPPSGASRPGGNAAALDWTILSGWQPSRPWLLAGGLRPDNVRAAIVASHAPGVDVSSGVESAPGVKDPTLIARFVEAAHLHA